MDNFTINIEAEGSDSLRKALEIAFKHNAPGGRAERYSVVRLSPKISYFSNPSSDRLPDNVGGIEGRHISHSEGLELNDKGILTLILIWGDSGGTELPFPITSSEAVGFVDGWLRNAGDPGNAPDIDGSFQTGWRVFTEEWGHVHNCHSAIVGVQAVHSLYGK